MKKLKNYVVGGLYIVIFMAVLLSIYRSDSMKSPEKLLETPIYNENYSAYFDEVKNFTSMDTNFVLPKNIKNTGGMSLIDLDNDSNRELIVFKKKSLESQGYNTIQMYVFKLDSEGHIIDENEAVESLQGDSINFADFVDINGDGKKEIVLDISGKSSKKLYIFDYEDKNLKKLYVGSQNGVDSSILATEDFGSGKYQAFLFDIGNFEKSEDESKVVNIVTVSMLLYENGKYITDPIIEKRFDESISKVEVNSGFVADGKKGLVVSCFTDGGDKITSVIVKDGSEISQFGSWVSSHNEASDNSCFYPTDIDSDSIIDIPMVDTKVSFSLPKNCKIINWFNWDGKGGSDSSMKFKFQTFYAIDSNLKLKIPKELVDKLYVSRRKDLNYTAYDFSVEKADGTINQIFTITVSQNNSEGYETKNGDNSEKNIVLKDQNSLYELDIKDNSFLKNKNLNFDKIKSNIGFINK